MRGYDAYGRLSRTLESDYLRVNEFLSTKNSRPSETLAVTTWPMCRPLRERLESLKLRIEAILTWSLRQYCDRCGCSVGYKILSAVNARYPAPIGCPQFDEGFIRG
jgi:hypothetical protein